MIINIFDLAGYTPISFAYKPRNISRSIDGFYPKNLRTIGIIHHSTKNPRLVNLGLNTINTQQLTEICLWLTIQYPKITGKNITHGWTSGIPTAKKKMRPSSVIATTTNHRQNAASGWSYLSCNGATLWYIDHYCTIDNHDSVKKPYWAINDHAILLVLPRQLYVVTLRMHDSFRSIYSSRICENR